MDPEALIEWLSILANTNAARIAIVQDLLKHAGEDHMSAEDRVTCREALSLLETGSYVTALGRLITMAVPEAAGPVKLPEPLNELYPMEM